MCVDLYWFPCIDLFVHLIIQASMTPIFKPDLPTYEIIFTRWQYMFTQSKEALHIQISVQKSLNKASEQLK